MTRHERHIIPKAASPRRKFSISLLAWGRQNTSGSDAPLPPGWRHFAIMPAGHTKTLLASAIPCHISACARRASSSARRKAHASPLSLERRLRLDATCFATSCCWPHHTCHPLYADAHTAACAIFRRRVSPYFSNTCTALIHHAPHARRQNFLTLLSMLRRYHHHD